MTDTIEGIVIALCLGVLLHVGHGGAQGGSIHTAFPVAQGGATRRVFLLQGGVQGGATCVAFPLHQGGAQGGVTLEVFLQGRGGAPMGVR